MSFHVDMTDEKIGHISVMSCENNFKVKNFGQRLFVVEGMVGMSHHVCAQEKFSDIGTLFFIDQQVVHSCFPRPFCIMVEDIKGSFLGFS